MESCSFYQIKEYEMNETCSTHREKKNAEELWASKTGWKKLLKDSGADGIII
jgi:hypothetical protein